MIPSRNHKKVFKKVYHMYCLLSLSLDDGLVKVTEISEREYRYEVACNRLAVEAVKRGCTDNVTVLIVDIIKPVHQK